MIRTATLFFFSLIFILPASLQAQNIITQWNFNSNPPDASNTTGSTVASTGTGTISTIGGATAAFSSGSANGGSSDPGSDNTGWNISGFPAQGAANKTAGIQFSASTVGHQNIVVMFDLRHSNTAPRHFSVQYTTDVNASPVVWTEFTVDSTTAGDTWVNKRTYDMSSISALANNANAGFRVVAAFRPATSTYIPSTLTSNYATTGTWRFDMITIKDTTYPALGAVSFVGTRADVMETTTEVKVVAKIMGGGAAASADLEILPISTATAGTDYVIPASMKFEWEAGADNVNDTIIFTINNDALAEPAEYFIVRLVNPVNVTLPAATANHFTVMIMDDDRQAPVATQSVTLQHVASFSNGTAGTNSAEIVAHDPATQRLFIANSIGGKIDIVDFSNPASASLISSIAMTPYDNINSIAFRNGVLAAAVENADPQLPGKVVFFNASGNFISQVEVGAMPDMITFNHAGTKVLTANEGEPNANYTIDPEGSISIIDISGGVANVTAANVTTATFGSFNSQAAALRAAGVRIFGPGATVAQDMEPEYITISDNDQLTYVACQENNAIAVVDIATATVIEIRPLGIKDHMAAGNALDVSDQGGLVQIANWPVKGLYMPDAIASYRVGGETYIITANEGDAREYTGAIVEAQRLGSSSYTLDPVKFPYAEALKANLGRLNVTNASGDTDGDGDFDEIHAFGARSISIWNATTGALVWDSKDEMEVITAKHPVFGAIFNASNANNNLKNRSDDKGPEPEGIALGEINGKQYAFVALERIGGCMVYDVTDPANPLFVDYANTRSVATYGGDNGAEGVIFISAANSPNGKPMVILANEVSSTLTFYNINTPVLNIALAGISASNNGSYNKINWNTHSEATGDRFELQRSTDGNSFRSIANINANGTPSAYVYKDESPAIGVNYYRLQLHHVDGTSTYSRVVTATTGVANKALVKVFPNPVTDKLVVRVDASQTGAGQVRISNLAGVVVLAKTINQQVEIDMQELPAGIYTVTYSNNSYHEAIQVVKK
ncbi:choice-of-anchor I family protein [Aridibaculum aurantiacum]|uniref:choice-of-anchor I family protein n=1 Tax=Aridibaculum aurantiacum TaxID=2810307 RepID=UPI001A979477|nr:choice-of-anchor I family protein [Aridibaculum aurantiacum]